MTIADYLNAIKDRLLLDPLIVSFRIWDFATGSSPLRGVSDARLPY